VSDPRLSQAVGGRFFTDSVFLSDACESGKASGLSGRFYLFCVKSCSVTQIDLWLREVGYRRLTTGAN
jgi:hypothetical protein